MIDEERKADEKAKLNDAIKQASEQARAALAKGDDEAYAAHLATQQRLRRKAKKIAFRAEQNRSNKRRRS